MLKNLRIGARLSILLAVMVVLVAVVLGLGLRGMGMINASLKTVYEDRTVALVQLGIVERDLYAIRVSLYGILSGGALVDRAQALRNIEGWDREIDAQWKEYLSTYLAPEEKPLAAEIDTRLGEYRAVRQQVMDFLAADVTEAAYALAVGEAAPRFQALEAAIVKDIALQDRIAKQEYQTSAETYATTKWINFAVVGLGLLLGLGLAIAIVRSITGSIAEMVEVMTRLANADTSVEVTGRDRRDEIGDMAKAVEVFKHNAIERTRLEAEEKASLARRELRQSKLENLTSDFDGTVMAVLGGVSAAAHKMNEMSRSMTAIAEETQRQGAAVSSATEQASANVSTIASASNELSASIQEISSQVNRSATIAANAVTEVDATTRKMESLAQGANRIGEVVDLINDIASQTNLLALNATIEAARAGEAGKGFAVVANEVKTLANQTGKATGEIAGQIKAIQEETHGVVEAIQRITAVINEINEMSAAIASAIEQQGAAMQEVVRNVEEVSVGTREVASNISQVVEAAGHTGNMAGQVQTAAGLLTDESDQLRGSVEQFLGGVKAA
jgi:methyl-accepting chemotaxis protein